MSEAKSIYPLLCQSWGECDLPCAFIAYTEAEVRKFIVNEWWGDDTDEGVDEVMSDLRDHDWKDEPEWHVDFEIGGVSFKPVYESNSRAAVQAPQPEAVGWKLVPIEPTEDMFVDGMEADCCGRPSVDDDAHVRSIWNAMLASAPTPEPMSAPTAKPVAWAVLNEDGDMTMVFPDRTEAATYCDGDEPVPLYTTPPSAATPEPSDAEGLSSDQIEAGAKELSKCMDYPWDHMPHTGRSHMLETVKAIDAAIRSSKGGKL